MRARAIQSVSSPSIRCPTLSNGLKVSGPSVPRIQGVLAFNRSARNVAGVRSSISTACARSNSTLPRLPLGLLAGAFGLGTLGQLFASRFAIPALVLLGRDLTAHEQRRELAALRFTLERHAESLSRYRRRLRV